MAANLIGKINNALARLASRPGVTINRRDVLPKNLNLLTLSRLGLFAGDKLENRFVKPFIRLVSEAHGLEVVNEALIVEELLAAEAIEPGALNVPQEFDCYRALVWSEMQTGELGKLDDLQKRQAALLKTLHSLYSLKNPQDLAEGLVRCVREGLGYDNIRAYQLEVAKGEYYELLQVGETIPSRFKDGPKACEEKEEKGLLCRILQRELSEDQIKRKAADGQYQWISNGSWGILHIPSRKIGLANGFVDPARYEADQVKYQGRADEMLFLVMGDMAKREKMTVYQITNWQSGEPLLKNHYDDVSLLSAFAEGLAVANENFNLLKDVKRLSVTDPLTSLANRRAFAAELLDQMKIASRVNKPLSIVVGDIDHFKKINDDQGHIFGDEALKSVARTMQEHLRDGDMVARLGGEEFFGILPTTDRAGAAVIVSRLCEAIAGLKLSFNEKPVPLTMSFGVVTVSPEEITEFLKSDQSIKNAEDKLKDPSSTVEENEEAAKIIIEKTPFLKMADAAVYHAKDSGRKQVVVNENGVFETVFKLPPRE